MICDFGFSLADEQLELAKSVPSSKPKLVSGDELSPARLCSVADVDTDVMVELELVVGIIHQAATALVAKSLRSASFGRV